MTTNPRDHARRAADALEALARATIDNPGALPIPDLYAIASDLCDAARHLAQIAGQLDQHVTSRASGVRFRLDAHGVDRYGEPVEAVAAVSDDLATTRSGADLTARCLTNALMALSTIAETGPHR